MKAIKKVVKLVLCCTFAITSKLSASSLNPAEMEKQTGIAIKGFVKDYQDGRFTYISQGKFFYLPMEAMFGVWVTAKTQETVPSGRALALAFTKAYLAEVQRNKDTVNKYDYMCETFPTKYSGKLGMKNIAVKIAFWDENLERPKAPYLSEIDFYQGKFRYYEADPKTQALKLVLEESYDDAVKQVVQP